MNPLHVIGRWAVGSQQHARRNAMVAATTLAERRAQLIEVEEFLADRPVVPKPRDESRLDHIPDVSTGG